MKQDENWGSCPVQGRDWGGSFRCNDSTVEELTTRLDGSSREAGKNRWAGIIIPLVLISH
jgi:hypothetical protein